MAQVEEHLNQAKRNFKFLEQINSLTTDSTDWQVTACFYTAVHIINAHLSSFGLQYRSHNDVKDAINPEKLLSVSKLPEDEYISYVSLQTLSRRSRYLVNEKDKNLRSTNAAFTHTVHLSKALRHLDILISYYCDKYSVSITPIEISCPELNGSQNLRNYIIKN